LGSRTRHRLLTCGFACGVGQAAGSIAVILDRSAAYYNQHRLHQTTLCCAKTVLMV